MNDIWAGLQSAFWLILTLDADLVEITLRSLQVSLTALVIASALALPLGTWLAIRRFRYRRFAISVLNALMGLPPVVVGLIVYLLLSRSGPFGVFGLLFTPTAMIIAQVIIITPLIASVTHQAMRELWAEYHDLLISLNTTKRQRVMTLIWDGRRTLLTAALAGSRKFSMLLMEITEPVEMPLHFVFAAAGKELGMARIKIVIREGASLKIVESHLGGASLNSSLLEFDVKAGAQLS